MIFSEVGLSILFFPSVITNVGFFSNQDRSVLSYSHTKDTSSWFKSANISIRVKRSEISKWMLYGVGLDVVIKNSSSEVIFNGYVNKIDVNLIDSTVAFTVGGYVDFLEFPYENTGATTYTTREKIIDVLEAEPNTIFSTEYSFIETNTLSVFEEETNNNSGQQIIKSLASLGGDSNNNRRIYGIKEDRTFFIEELPTTVTYLASSPTSVSVGPLTDIVNQSKTNYKDFVTGEKEETSIANDTISQGKYGIFTQAISGGEVSQGNAESIRDTYINENSEPATSQVISGDIEIKKLSGGTFDPWDILPGRWLQFTSLGPDMDSFSDFRQDIKLMFIESVNFSLPRTISLTGIKVSTLEQRLAKLGLGSI